MVSFSFFIKSVALLKHSTVILLTGILRQYKIYTKLLIQKYKLYIFSLFQRYLTLNLAKTFQEACKETSADGAANLRGKESKIKGIVLLRRNTEKDQLCCRMKLTERVRLK